jgi:hypothetical protein
MTKPFKTGNREYRFKKDGLNFYKKILNSYDFGESASQQHYQDLIDLITYDASYFDDHNHFTTLDKLFDDEKKLLDLRIGKAQFKTKSFELVFDNGETDFISYILRITKRKPDLLSKFFKAARKVTFRDLRHVKQENFDKNSKKGLVPCLE